MNRLIPAAGFLLLTAMVIILLGLTVYEAWILSAGGGVLVVAVSVGTLIQMVREAKRVPCVQFGEAMNLTNALNFLAVVAGALITYILSIDLGLGAVTASGLIGVLAALVIPDYAVPAYCGSFAGMSSARLLGSHWEIVLAGSIAGLIFILTDCAYPGFGGKLGAIAFTGCVIMGLSLRRPFIVTPIPDPSVAMVIIIASVAATVATYWLSITLGHGAVMASGFVGLLGGLILPAIYPDTGPLLAVMVICASFSGMSSAAKFPSITMMLGAGLVTGVIFVYSMPQLGGAGGKLGTIAFASVMAVRSYYDLVETRFDSLLQARQPESGSQR